MFDFRPLKMWQVTEQIFRKNGKRLIQKSIFSKPSEVLTLTGLQAGLAVPSNSSSIITTYQMFSFFIDSSSA